MARASDPGLGVTRSATTEALFGPGFSRQEVILLLRYLPAKLMLHRLKPFFLLKYLLVLLIGAALVVGAPMWLAVVPFVLFLLAAVGQWLIRTTIKRLGAMRQLTALDGEVDEIIDVWWPNLCRELARLGDSARPWALVRLGARLAVAQGADAESALPDIDWQTVIPVDRWHRVRNALLIAAGRSPAPHQRRMTSARANQLGRRHPTRISRTLRCPYALRRQWFSLAFR